MRSGTISRRGRVNGQHLDGSASQPRDYAVLREVMSSHVSKPMIADHNLVWVKRVLPVLPDLVTFSMQGLSAACHAHFAVSCQAGDGVTAEALQKWQHWTCSRTTIAGQPWPLQLDRDTYAHSGWRGLCTLDEPATEGAQSHMITYQVQCGLAHTRMQDVHVRRFHERYRLVETAKMTGSAGSIAGCKTSCRFRIHPRKAMVCARHTCTLQVTQPQLHARHPHPTFNELCSTTSVRRRTSHCSFLALLCCAQIRSDLIR